MTAWYPRTGSHTSAIIGNCKTKKVFEFVSRELPVRHSIRCPTNMPLTDSDSAWW